MESSPKAVSSVNEVTALFNSLFSKTENTRIESGGVEPLYSPLSSDRSYNKIVSNQDFVSSALHEISHWCLAGEYRRTLEDYGYWYEPDGRSEDQQALFEKVEVEPQALEWMFSKACGHVFRVSADNLDNENAAASDEFKMNLVAQVNTYINEGLPERAQLFLEALEDRYQSQLIARNANFYAIAHLN